MVRPLCPVEHPTSLLRFLSYPLCYHLLGPIQHPRSYPSPNGRVSSYALIFQFHKQSMAGHSIEGFAEIKDKQVYQRFSLCLYEERLLCFRRPFLRKPSCFFANSMVLKLEQLWPVVYCFKLR